MKCGGAAPGAAGERASGHGNSNSHAIVESLVTEHQPEATRRMRYFPRLEPAEQHAAVRRLAASGMGVGAVAAAARVSCEQVQEILGQPETTP